MDFIFAILTVILQVIGIVFNFIWSFTLATFMIGYVCAFAEIGLHNPVDQHSAVKIYVESTYNLGYKFGEYALNEAYKPQILKE